MAFNRQQIEKLLLVPDGAARDVNLFGVDEQGVVALLNHLCGTHDADEITVYDATGHAIEAPPNRPWVEVPTRAESIRSVFSSGSACPRHIQCFVYREAPSWFVELTFFPQDVLAAVDPFRALLTSIEGAGQAAGADTYFVRMEDASFAAEWKNRQHREVIITSEDVPSFLAG